MTVHQASERATVCPHHRHTNVKYLNQPVWQPKCNSSFYLEGDHMAARTFRKKKQQSRVFFGVIFYVYTNVDNKERTRASYKKNKGNEFRRKTKRR